MRSFAVNDNRLMLVIIALIGALATPYTLTASSHEPPATFKTHHFISFIVPVYNRANLVKRALDSIYCQNLALDNFEIICIDDGSIDDTYRTLQNYRETKNNITILRHEKNQGAAAARNTGIAVAKGDLIFPLDSDNRLVPHSVPHLINLLDASKCDAASFEEIRYVDRDGNHVRSHFSRPPGSILNIHTVFSPHHLALSSGNYLYTRESYNRAGGYQTYALETLIFGILQIASGSTVAVLPNSYYLHGLSSDSKWVADQERGLNISTLLYVLAQLDEIFTPEAILLINQLPRNYQNIYADFSSFRKRPGKALESLFAAYRLDHTHNFAAARNAYQNAIALGCDHPKTIKRLARVEHILAQTNQ